MNFSRVFQKYRLQILLVAASRVFYSAWLAVVWILVEKWLPVSPQSLWETYYHLTPSSTLIGRALIDVWLRWDAVHYMNIAAFGYQGVGKPDTVYFPLYPYLVGGLSKLTTINVTVVGILVSSLAALFALICLRELVVQLFNDEKLANWSTVLFALYPAALFLHAPYTEGLFLLFVIGSVLMMVRRKWLLAGLFASAGGLTRAEGLLLLIPMAGFYIQERLKDKTIFKWREIFSITLAPLGIGAYSLWRSLNGVPGFFQSYLVYSSTTYQLPLITLAAGINQIIHKPAVLPITELISALFFLAILIWMFARREFRPHLPILLYSAANWILITSKTVWIASPLQSSNRYVLHIFFAFVGMAAMVQKWPAKIRGMIVLLFAIGMLVAATLYALWIFVG